MMKFDKYYEFLMENSWDDHTAGENPNTLTVITGGYTSYGSHSWGDNEEVPAEEPSKYIEVEKIYDWGKLTQLMKKYGTKPVKAIYMKSRWGSYHTSALNIQVDLEITDIPENAVKFYEELLDIEIEPEEYGVNQSSSLSRVDKMEVPFKSFKQIEDGIREFMQPEKPKSKPESSKKYWDKEIRKAVDSVRTYDGD